jgi:tetratricopeptide (TPR) repeat protein
MLAHHFAEAEDVERALRYATAAAERAAHLFALREEMQHRQFILEAALSLPGASPAVRIDAILNWVRVSHFLNRYDGLVERIEEAIAAARGAGDKPRLASALSWFATIQMVTGFPSRGAAAIEEAQLLAAEVDDERLLLLPLFMGTFTLVDRDPRAGAEKLGDLIELARKHQFPEVQSHAMAYRAVALARTGDFEAARRQAEEALDFAPHAGSPVKEADVHIGVAAAYYDMGEFDKAAEHAKIGAEGALAANGLECACAGFYELGRVQLGQRRIDDALSDFNRSLGYGYAAGFHGYINAIRGNTALAEFEQGAAASLDKLRMAIENAQSLNDGYAVATMSTQLASALVRLGRHDEARPLLMRSLQYFRERSMRPYLATALELMVRIHEASGSSAEAETARSEAAGLRQELNLPLSVLPQEIPSEVLQTAGGA